MDEATRLIDSLLVVKYGHAMFEDALLGFSAGKIREPDVTLVRKYSQDDETIYSLINSQHGIEPNEIWPCPVLQSFHPSGAPMTLNVIVKPELTRWG